MKFRPQRRKNNLNNLSVELSMEREEGDTKMTKYEKGKLSEGVREGVAKND